MQSFKALSEKFERSFAHRIFPPSPKNLYDPAQYILGLGGKRVRPVLCLMGNELFEELSDDAYAVAAAVELFHNFTLVHDDIMDQAPLRRGKPAVHKKYGEDSALLAGDVMLVYAYGQINQIDERYLKRIIEVFSRTAGEVCEGQQLDMDYAALPLDQVDMEAYMGMIALKTSVLLAGSLKMGGILGGGSEGNLDHLYAFGKNMGIAFQIHDDYLDAFGDPLKFGKQPGGDILVNKKTFLLLKAWEQGSQAQCDEIRGLLQGNDPCKVERMLSVYHACKVDEWAREEKNRYVMQAREELEKVTVLSTRKKELEKLMGILLDRES
ncbi:MAG TPA: polyprenyl synthetase family protein [Chitinophagaceae bacterium]|jgi:geranylgeranyl diphosphate synthase type II|nr:polyprenyl synthetase family protein [Chitinophagaceae bacterium]